MSHDKNVHDKKMHDKKSYDKKENENIIEGRNAVMEAFRSGKPVDKLYVLDGCQDGAVRSIIREARKHDTILNFVEKWLDCLTGCCSWWIWTGLTSCQRPENTRV